MQLETNDKKKPDFLFIFQSFFVTLSRKREQGNSLQR